MCPAGSDGRLRQDRGYIMEREGNDSKEAAGRLQKSREILEAYIKTIAKKKGRSSGKDI